MKNLFTLLLLVFLVSCNNKSMFISSNYNNNFAVSTKKVYHKGIEIGYLESIKLEKDKGKIKYKYSFTLFETSENWYLAPSLLNYLNNNDSFKGFDLEVKVIK